MKSPTPKTIAVTSAVLVLSAVTYVFFMRPQDDADRYRSLRRLGQSYRRAWSGQPRWFEQCAASLHWSNPSNYYLHRFEATKQALVGSGYLVHLTVPAPNLQPKARQMVLTLSNTAQQTGAYYEAQLDHTRGEIRLLCRKEDISLWQKTLTQIIQETPE